MSEQEGFIDRLEQVRNRCSTGSATPDDARWLLFWLDDYMHCLGDVIDQRNALMLKAQDH